VWRGPQALDRVAALTLLSTSNLSRRFGGIEAVRNVNLSLEANRVRALIGPNGAGKTTLVGMLCGRIEPSGGDVIFDGRTISALPAHQRIRLGMAYTFQITSIFQRLPVEENVALAARPHSSNVDDAVRNALLQIGLEHRRHDLAGDLSYGHQRLLEIAMGIVQMPRLLILDEPTQGLSENEVDAFIDLVRDLRSKTTILLIEHNMDVVMRTADKITVLNFGEILAEGDPEAIQSDQAVQTAYLGGAA
jgi:branched-chain amino acid transport system ATP-binding protein